MIYLYIVLSFLAGVVAMAYACHRVFVRMETADPMRNPRSRDEKRVRQAVERQLTRWKRDEYQDDPKRLVTVQDTLWAMAYFANNGEVWTAEDGILTLPNGVEVPMRDLAVTVAELLPDAYVAVVRLASLLTDSTEYLPLDSDLRNEIRKVAEGTKFAFEPVAVQLAKCMGREDDCGDLALELWERNRAWMDAEHRDSTELNRALKALGMRRAGYGEPGFAGVVEHLLSIAHFIENPRLRDACERLLTRSEAFAQTVQRREGNIR